MSLPVVLIADKLAESTVAALGDQIEVRWVDGPDREKLLAAVPEADALLRAADAIDPGVPRGEPPQRARSATAHRDFLPTPAKTILRPLRADPF